MHGRYKPIKFSKSDIVHVIIAVPVVLAIAFLILTKIP